MGGIEVTERVAGSAAVAPAAQQVDERGARWAIQELVARYNMAWDSTDGAGVVACFTSDGVFVDATGTEHHGAEAIAAFVHATPQQFGRMRHITSTHLVTDLSETAARHRCYVVLASNLDVERRLDTGEYEDALALVEGEWLFVRRIVRFD